MSENERTRDSGGRIRPPEAYVLNPVGIAAIRNVVASTVFEWLYIHVMARWAFLKVSLLVTREAGRRWPRNKDVTEGAKRLIASLEGQPGWTVKVVDEPEWRIVARRPPHE